MKLGRRVEEFAITAIDRDGLPYGPFEGGKLYVDKSLPGDIADVQAIRVSKGDFPVSTGRIVRLLEASPDRIDPFCPHFEHCGGCPSAGRGRGNPPVSLSCSTRWEASAAAIAVCSG